MIWRGFAAGLMFASVAPGDMGSGESVAHARGSAVVGRVRTLRLRCSRARPIRNAGIVTLAGITANSLVELGAAIQLPVAPGTLAYCVLAVACLWAAMRVGGPWLPLIVAASIRLAVIATIHPVLVSDWAKYERLLNQSPAAVVYSPMFPTGLSMILGALYALFGVHPLFSEILNLGAAIGTTWLVYRMAGSIPAMMFALMPAQILMTALLSTEVPYAFALTLIVWLVVARRSWLLAGLAVGLSQYLRSSAELLALAVAFAYVKRLRQLLLLLAAASIALLPVLAWNLANGSISASTSSYLGWQVMIGTNQKYNGAFNDEDLALHGPDDFVTGLRRIVVDPLGFAALVTRKVPVTWGDEGYAPYWTVGSDSPSYSTWLILSQLGLTVLAVSALMSTLRAPPSRAGLVSLGILCVFAVAYVFTESQGRYHFYFVPLLAILARSPISRPQPRSPWPRPRGHLLGAVPAEMCDSPPVMEATGRPVDSMYLLSVWTPVGHARGAETGPNAGRSIPWTDLQRGRLLSFRRSLNGACSFRELPIWSARTRH